jgi:aminoglycoside phosphotransferase (APT) family kinase protein
MSRADGPCFADVMRASSAESAAHLKAMAVLHSRIHACKVVFFGGVKARLAANIERSTLLSERRRHDLLEELGALPDGDRLCHGDFHPWNVLGPVDAPVVIDWTSAAKGSPAADVCRSYVLVKPSAPELALSYVETYAQATGEGIDDIFKWLRVVAAARLAEGVDKEVDGLLAILDDERAGRGQAGTQ